MCLAFEISTQNHYDLIYRLLGRTTTSICHLKSVPKKFCFKNLFRNFNNIVVFLPILMMTCFRKSFSTRDSNWIVLFLRNTVDSLWLLCDSMHSIECVCFFEHWIDCLHDVNCEFAAVEFDKYFWLLHLLRLSVSETMNLSINLNDMLNNYMEFTCCSKTRFRIFMLSANYANQITFSSGSCLFLFKMQVITFLCDEIL